MKRLDKATVLARAKGEKARTIANICARTERPKQAWWLSFATDEGFRGAVIVHAEDFIAAVMECNLRDINPHGECQGLPIPDGDIVPEKWKYRILSLKECEQFDREMQAIEEQA